MRVLYFHQHFSTPKGSAGTRSYEMARRLIGAGHEVTIVCGSYSQGKTGLSGEFRKGRREGVVDGIRVIEFDLSYANKQGFFRRASIFLQFALRSIGVALREPADLVFATSTPLTAAIPGIAAKWLRRRPFVFEVRDLWPELPREMGIIRNPIVLGMLGSLEYAAYKSADGLVGLSPGIVEGIARRGINRDRIVMIPNGCDLSLFDQEAQPWRPDGVGPGDCMAVFTGTHGIANGLDAAVAAAVELKACGRSDIKLVLVGDGMEKPRLMARARTERVDDIVLFNPPVAKEALAGLFRASDVGLQFLANVPAFYYGTSPNKFFDYLSAGLPVVTNYPGWIADMLGSSGAGIAVPPDKPKELARQLQRLADDPDRRRAMARHARELAGDFARDLLAERFVAALTQAVPPKRPASHNATR